MLKKQITIGDLFLKNSLEMLRKKLKLNEQNDQQSENASRDGQESEKFVVEFEKLFYEHILKLEHDLVTELLKIDYPKEISQIYNPLEYASELHVQFLQKYLKKKPDVLFIGT